MNKEIEIPEGYEARIEGNKVVLEPKESEDEGTRRMIENTLREAAISELISEKSYRKMIAYLEKHRANSTEWSEEDKGMLNCIIATLCEESHGGRETNDKMVTWLENKLKSFSPKPNWKPSEEQIDALDAVYKTHYMLHANKSTILKLLNDLKKLM